MPHRVLVVEDSAMQAKMLRFILEEAGYATDVAPDGQAALNRVAGQAYDLVVSDIRMPGMDGYELCRRIKTELGKRQLPVMLLTSLGDPMDIVRGLEAGADNYVTKPYEPAHLLARIANMLENRRLRSGVRSRRGVNVTFLGSTLTINSDKEQILDLLISTFEDAVIQNRQLRRREEELEVARAALARYADTLEERLRRVLESVPDVVFSVSPTLTAFHYLSPASVRVLGFSGSQANADPGCWQRAIHAEDRPRVEQLYALAVTAGRGGTVEYRLSHPDGTTRWIEETVVPISDGGGGATRLDGIARDITERKRLEEQLRLSQKMEAIGTLAGGVAHDFNNLLAAIQGSADLMLLDLGPQSRGYEEITDIVRVVERAAALTRQLLAFGRKQLLEPRILDLSAQITETAKMLRRLIGADVDLRLDLTQEPATVMADPGQIEQLAMNLCVNARDAMPDGGELTVQTERVWLDEAFAVVHPWASPGEYVRLTITDTGVGMDAATQQRIFEPFFTTKEAGEGTGLGLAVVYGIVKQHGGLIHVYSEPGQGTAFRVYLPFRTEAAEPAAVPIPQRLARGTGTILLAEDDDSLRVTATKLLEHLGYRVIPVANGQEAVDLLTRLGREIDAAILDVVMPGLAGPAVFEQVRHKHPTLRFLFTTGYSPGTSHVAPLKTLPGQVLHKPYGIEALAFAVQRVLGH
jgi:two-component system cell cycle sensor histidine kinase/response regulator CckA